MIDTSIETETDPAAESIDRMLVQLQAELRAIAARHMATERSDHTLQPTALINEAYLRMLEQANLKCANRATFLAAAARIMRRILVDHARARNAEKRGGDRGRVTLSGIETTDNDRNIEIMALDEALEKLRGHSERIHEVVMLRYFSGLTVDEVADVLRIAPRTVHNDWNFGRAWLIREMGAA